MSELVCCKNADGKDIPCSPADCGCFPCCAYCRRYIWKSFRKKHCGTDSCPNAFSIISDFVEKYKFELWSVANGNT